jgi:hypothetical protein
LTLDDRGVIERTALKAQTKWRPRSGEGSAKASRIEGLPSGRWCAVE